MDRGLFLLGHCVPQIRTNASELRQHGQIEGSDREVGASVSVLAIWR